MNHQAFQDQAPLMAATAAALIMKRVCASRAIGTAMRPLPHGKPSRTIAAAAGTLSMAASLRRHRLPQFKPCHCGRLLPRAAPYWHPRIGYVTGHLTVSYPSRPPTNQPLHLRARITKTDGRKVWVDCTLSAAARYARGRGAGDSSGTRRRLGVAGAIHHFGTNWFAVSVPPPRLRWAEPARFAEGRRRTPPATPWRWFARRSTSV